MTTSTPRSPHGTAAGPSAMDQALIRCSPTTRSSSSTDTSCGKRPRTESYLSRCARVLLSIHRTEEVSADTPEAVHAHPDSHSDLLVVLWSGRCIDCTPPRV